MKKQIVARLKMLRDLKREIDMLSQQIAELALREKGRGWNWLPRRNPNLDGAAREEKIRDLSDMLERRRVLCLDELGRLYAFIDSIGDSRMRQILSRRYVDGMTWQQVAFAIGEYDEQYPRKLHDSFLRHMDEKDENGPIG